MPLAMTIRAARPATPRPRLALVKQTPRPTLDVEALSAAVRKLLNRPTYNVARYRQCKCAGCKRTRAVPITCKHCGYVGAPAVVAPDRQGPPHACKAPCDDCGHGTVFCCPVCEDGDAYISYADRYDNPWTLIRELRAILVTQGVL